VISTDSPQAGAVGTRYLWSSWSDGGEQTHTISPRQAGTYTANFTTQYQLTTSVSPAAAGTVSASPPAGDGFYDAGASVQLTANADAGYVFSNWTGDLTGSANPQTLTMSAPRSVTANFAGSTVPVTVQTSPVGRSFTVDGAPYTTPQNFNWTPGSNHTIATTPVQDDTSPTRFVWASWSDGGAISHTVSPTSATTYTANFTTQHRLNGIAGPGGTVNPILAYFNAGQTTQITATPNAGYRFVGWTGIGNGSYTGPDNPAQVTVREPLTEIAAFAPLGRSPFDFDGDGRSDISVFRPSNGQWWLNRSNAGLIAHTFGNGADIPVPADFTGDGSADVAVFRPSNGEWLVLRSENFTFYSFPFGANGDVPVPGDYDGDRLADAAVFRPSGATWFILRSSGGTTIEGFGSVTDRPVPADYDGDGRTDIAIYRPSVGQWWLNRSAAGVIAHTFGNAEDRNVPGDYTGDGKADVAIWRPSNGQWYVLRSEDYSFYSFPFGISTDTPVPADYDGDGRFDAGVFRSSNATWYLNRSTAGMLIEGFGFGSDVPVPTVYVR
jgi:hypothetical protein